MLDRLQLTAIADANGIIMRNSDDRRDRRSKVVGRVRRSAAVLELGISGEGTGGGRANRTSSKLRTEPKTYRQIYAVVGGHFR